MAILRRFTAFCKKWQNAKNYTHNPKVVGSNPASATKYENRRMSLKWLH